MGDEGDPPLVHSLSTLAAHLHLRFSTKLYLRWLFSDLTFPKSLRPSKALHIIERELWTSLNLRFEYRFLIHILQRIKTDILELKGKALSKIWLNEEYIILLQFRLEILRSPQVNAVINKSDRNEIEDIGRWLEWFSPYFIDEELCYYHWRKTKKSLVFALFFLLTFF